MHNMHTAYLHIIEAKWMHVTVGCSSAQIIKAEGGTENIQDIKMPKTFIEPFFFCKIGDAVIYTISPKFEMEEKVCNS